MWLQLWVSMIYCNDAFSSPLIDDGIVDAGRVHVPTNILHSFNRYLLCARHCTNPQNTAVNETQIPVHRKQTIIEVKRIENLRAR